MKITIHLPDDLIQRATKAALETNTTLTGFIESALREALARRKSGDAGREFKVATYGYGGLQPGVNLDDTSALLDIMEPPNEIWKKLTG
jgi:hypothetical protein